MNDEELESRLRERLHRRITPGDTPERLVDSVARIGLDDSPEALGAWDRAHRFRRRAGALGGLATAACIAAVIAVSLFWRSSAAPSQPSSVVSGTWTGPTVDVSYYDRLDSSFAWAVGSTGGGNDQLFVTEDDGSTWEVLPVPYVDGAGPVSPIVFTDRDHAFVAVTTGQYTETVLRSSDGGHLWTRSVVYAQSGFHTFQLDMLDDQHGWLLLVNSSEVWQLLATTDGGVIWTPVADTSKVKNAPNQVHFVSANEGWGSTRSNGIVHTLDGGKTWTAGDLPALAGSDSIAGLELWPQGSVGNLVLHGIVQHSPAQGEASEIWMTWTSADDGLHWTAAGTQPIGEPSAVTVVEAPGLDPGLAGYATSDTASSLVLLAPDGQPFTFGMPVIAASASHGYSLRVSSARAFSGTEAWIDLNTCFQPSIMTSGGFLRQRFGCTLLLATSDGGKTWRPLLGQIPTYGPTPSPTVAEFPPCCAMDPIGEPQRPREPLIDWLDPTHGWAVVGTSLYWTADAGRTWSSGSPLPASGTIQFIDAEHGWLVASDSSDPGSVIYARAPVFRTSDGGKTWTATTLTWPAADLPVGTFSTWTWAHFADATHGIVARCPALIAGQIEANCAAFTTDDGGLTFQGPVENTYATDLTWLSPTIGYGISYQMGVTQQTGPPLLDLTFDGGRTWTSQALETISGAPWLVPLAMELTPGASGRLLVSYSDQKGTAGLARYETTNGGRSWSLAWHGPGDPVSTVRVAGADLVGVSQSNFWSSSDFGVTWQKLAAAPLYVHDFDFTDAATGWLLRAPTYSSSPDALLATNDGGRTWRVVLNAPSIITNP